jgi:hypothetical protein
VLLLAAAAALVAGLELVFAAAGDGRDVWRVVPVSGETPARILALCGLSLLFATCLVLICRPRDPGIVVEVAEGAVVVRRQSLNALAEEAFATHPDVVGVRARTSTRDGRLVVDARVLLRPGVDVTALGPRLRADGVDGLSTLTGLSSDARRLRFRVLRVDQLARHL